MKVLDFLKEDAIQIGLKATTKPAVIDELAEVLSKAKLIVDKKKAVKTLMDREELGSTGVGQGVAIPHGKTDMVKDLIGALGVSRTGIAFDALDGEPVHLFFVLLAPNGAGGAHLKALARISSLLKDKHIRKALMEADDKKKILDIIRAEEKLRG